MRKIYLFLLTCFICSPLLAVATIQPHNDGLHEDDIHQEDDLHMVPTKSADQFGSKIEFFPDTHNASLLTSNISVSGIGTGLKTSSLLDNETRIGFKGFLSNSIILSVPKPAGVVLFVIGILGIFMLRFRKAPTAH